MRIASLFTNKKAWSAAIAAVLLLACFIPVQSAAAATHVAVDGRTLSAIKAGDNSDWIEIAKYGDYSLIIRQTPITSKLTYFHDQHKNLADNKYVFSVIRKTINNWYNNTLSQTARLRNFAVGNDIDPVKMWNTGTVGVFNGPKSTPNGIAKPKGEEVAFALSFAEAAQFCGTQYVTTTASVIACPAIAIKNFNKLLPKGNGSTDPNPAYWLRSDGIGSSTIAAGCVAYTGGSPYDNTKGRVHQHTVIGHYGHYRPAMWVGSGIFEDYTVTYEPNGGTGTRNVYPVALNSNYTIVDQGYRHANPSYQFDSWNTRADGLGIRYVNGQTITITASITLYAQWRALPVPPLNVIYTPNGGIGNIFIDTAPANSNYTIRDQGYRPANSTFEFDGWNTRADGLGVRYSNNQVIYLTATLTLYAQWRSVGTPPPFMVIYDPNGGIGTTNIVQVPANTNYIIQDQGYTHPRSNYRFDGWNTMPNGAGTNYNNGNSVYMNNHLILYAKWRIVG